jgi:hypothetical protein
MSRAEAARLVVMERQAPRDAVVRYNAAGVEGLRNRPKPRRPPAQTEAERAVEGEALEPLSLPTAGSIRERRRYSALGKTAGGPWHCSDEGMIGQMPRQRAASQLAFVATLVDHHLPQRDVGADIEQDLELAAVAALPAHAVEIQRQAVEVPRYVDLGSLSAERRSTPPRERPSGRAPGRPAPFSPCGRDVRAPRGAIEHLGKCAFRLGSAT